MAAREVTISLRERISDNLPSKYKLVIPADWSKSQLLSYVRAVHPDDVVKLLTWGEIKTRNGEPLLWIANPRAFSNFKKGIGNWK